jgi:hypothetical protein
MRCARTVTPDDDLLAQQPHPPRAVTELARIPDGMPARAQRAEVGTDAGGVVMAPG